MLISTGGTLMENSMYVRVSGQIEMKRIEGAL